MTAEPFHLHASALVVGECGVLIEGPSGSGKSTLADRLIAEAAARGTFGCLVGDDRIALLAAHGRLVARPHPAIAGRIEHRGIGLVGVPHAPACVLHLAVRLVAGAEEDGLARMPEPQVRTLLGVALPLLAVPASAGPAVAARRVAVTLTMLASACRNLSNQLANSTAMHKIAPHGEAVGANAEPT